MNPRTTPMSLCPGNVQYMSPEALEEPPCYTDKLDVFSFGVLLVQIITRQFPNPGPGFQILHNDPCFPECTVKVSVPETQRRSSHLKLIADTHPLKGITISCLKGKERELPSAQQLSNTSELKQAPQYAESLQKAQTGVGGGRGVDSLQSQVQDVQQQNHTMEQDRDQPGREIEQHDQVQLQQWENEQFQTEQRREHDRVVQQLGKQLQGQKVLTEARTSEVQKLQSLVQEKERVLGQNRQLVAELQQSLQQKDRIISDLSQTVLIHERMIGQLEQQDKYADSQLPQSLAATKVPQVPAMQRNIAQLRWEEGTRAPRTMSRGAAVVEGNTVYINPSSSHEVYSCHAISGDQQWSTLASHPYSNFSLVLLNGLLTSVGGIGGDRITNSLLSLTGKGGKKQWSDIFPAMPTPRRHTASVATTQALVVAGGHSGVRRLNTVEVMDIPSQQWTTASCLPHRFSWMSCTICRDQLYLAGRYDESSKSSKSVLTCSLTDLLPPLSLGVRVRTLSLADKTGEYGDKLNIYQLLGLPSPHSVATCWLLVGEMTQAKTLQLFIVTTLALTRGVLYHR